MKPNSLRSTTHALNLVDGLRDELRERRQARVTYHELKRELAAYRTLSDVGDLLAAVDRQRDVPQGDQIRTILKHNLSDYDRRQRLTS